MIENTLADQRDFVSMPSNAKVILMIDKIDEKVFAGQAHFLRHFPPNQASGRKYQIHEADRLSSAFRRHPHESISPKEPEMLEAAFSMHGQGSQDADAARSFGHAGQPFK